MMPPYMLLRDTLALMMDIQYDCFMKHHTGSFKVKKGNKSSFQLRNARFSRTEHLEDQGHIMSKQAETSQ
jgi:hypothetical protein